MSIAQLDPTWEHQDYVESDHDLQLVNDAPHTRTPPAEQAHRWQRSYARSILALDAVMVTFAVLTAIAVRFGFYEGAGWSPWLLGLVPGWLLVLAASRAYEPRFLGVGSQELGRVFNASIRFVAIVAVASYALKLELSRGLVAIALPLGTLLILLGRLAARVILAERRKRGQWTHRVLVLGPRTRARGVIEQIRREPQSGFVVVGACEPRQLGRDFSDVVAAARAAGADTVAVVAGEELGAQELRQVSWDLEGTGIDLMVAPALIDVAGPRISVRPVAGLPLLHVEEAEFTGARRVLKRGLDVVGAGVGLLFLAPVLIGIAVLIRLGSPGLVIFRQSRVGVNGEEFCCWKFRSMYVDAEARLASLQSDNAGLLFKMRDDPRVTRVGKVLRRYSLDELPQLVNVLRGDMSLVGPRPPLPREVELYGEDVCRRLLTAPGMTGLWQVSGRSDLSWEDSVRLDLSYVENWSLALDLQILWRTVFAVVRGSGAY